MRNVFIYSSRPSDGAKELANALECRRIRPQGSSYQPRPNHTIINWGSIQPTVNFHPARTLNDPSVVARTSNKLAFFQHLTSTNSEARVVEWTVDQGVARSWVDNGGIAVARTVLSGHSGNGIVVIENAVDFVPAPLYTKYVRKEAEYRVHCTNDDVPSESYFNTTSWVFDVQRKIKDPAFTGEPNWRVRNHQNGFIYVRDNIQVPEDVKRQAVQAFEASGLDFGAVDVIWNQHRQEAFVLEINTAPGLTGRTVQSYKEALTSIL